MGASLSTCWSIRHGLKDVIDQTICGQLNTRPLAEQTVMQYIRNEEGLCNRDVRACTHTYTLSQAHTEVYNKSKYNSSV